MGPAGVAQESSSWRAGAGLGHRLSDRGRRAGDQNIPELQEGCPHLPPSLWSPLGLRVWFTAQVWCSGRGQEELYHSLLFHSGSFLSQFHFCHPSADPAKQGTSQPCSQHLPQLTVPPHPKSPSSPFHFLMKCPKAGKIPNPHPVHTDLAAAPSHVGSLGLGPAQPCWHHCQDLGTRTGTSTDT